MDRFGGAIFPHRLDSSINSRDFPALSEPFSGIFQLNSPARTVSEIGQERERERGIYKPLEQKCVGRRRRGKKKRQGVLIRSGEEEKRKQKRYIWCKTLDGFYIYRIHVDARFLYPRR